MGVFSVRPSMMLYSLYIYFCMHVLDFLKFQNIFERRSHKLANLYFQIKNVHYFLYSLNNKNFAY